MADFNPDDFLASQGTQTAAPAPEAAGGFDPDAFLNDQLQAQHGGVGSQIATGVEGAAEGLLGPIATGIEKMYVDPKDMKARAEANPISHGIGQAAGLTAGLMTGTGEAAAMEHVGDLAMKATGLTATKDIAQAGVKAATEATAMGADAATATQAAADAVKAAKGATSYSARVGSEVVKQAAENAVLQGGDEVSKAMLDPDYSAESAMGEIGMAAAIGGATGGIMQGVVSPLWSATVGKGWDASLNAVRNHLDGTVGKMTDDVAAASKRLGMEVDPMMSATMSGSEAAEESASKLKYAQNAEYLAAEDRVKSDVSERVGQASGVSPKELESFDNADMGAAAKEETIAETKARYAKPQESLEAREDFAKNHAPVSPEASRDGVGQVYQDFTAKYKPSNPNFKELEKWTNQLKDVETVHDIDQLRTQLGNEIAKANSFASPDRNLADVLGTIRDSLGNFAEAQIAHSAGTAEGAAAQSLVRKMASSDYKAYADVMREYMAHLGVGKFHGTGSFINKLQDIAPETFLKKLSAKNNAEIIPFLEKNFPATLEHMRQAEFKSMTSSAIKDGQLDVEKLAKIIDKAKQGRAGYVDFVFPQQFQQAVADGNTILSALVKQKDSGTPGGIKKLLSHLPTGALSAVAMMTGHNPIMGAVLGHFAEKAPEAFHLAKLKFLGSDAATSAPGLKAATDFLHASMNGDKALIKGSKAIFTAGKDVLSTNRIPDQKDRDKLDKAVVQNTENPNKEFNNLDGAHLGHYMPEHQTASAMATSNAMKYLATIKPHDQSLSPLQKPVPPSQEAIGRYNRALDIASNPHIVLQHIKNGTLLQSDMQDLTAMYPKTAQRMQQMLTQEVLTAHTDNKIIPYKTRLSLSMFLQQPLDATMLQPAIAAAQMTHQPQAQQRAQPQGQTGSNKAPNAKAGTMMTKGANSYQTATQQAESDRSNRS